MRKTQIICCLVFALLMLALPGTSSAQIAVGISVHIGPPVLPVYVQPVCPGPGYMWTPGYWAYGDDGYYWVPGTWVVAPIGMLWTPGYWGYAGGLYVWHAGYWGPHVGFYGGINYGFGYGGVGFVGGEWRGRVFAYNTAVTRVDTTIIHTTYVNRTVVNTTVVNRYSFNGPGGMTARPSHEEMVAEHEHHMEPLAAQRSHEHAAAADRSFRYSENHGRPAVAATGRPGDFHGHEVAAARGNEFHPPAHNDAHGGHNEAMAHPNNSNGHPNNNGHSNNERAFNNGSNHPSNESHNARPEAHEQSRPAQHEQQPRPAEHKDRKPQI